MLSFFQVNPKYRKIQKFKTKYLKTLKNLKKIKDKYLFWI